MKTVSLTQKWESRRNWNKEEVCSIARSINSLSQDETITPVEACLLKEVGRWLEDVLSSWDYNNLWSKENFLKKGESNAKR